MADDATMWIDIKTLKLWNRNPNEGDIGRIMVSIKEHGFNDTCHYWRGIVKAGNHSVMALSNLRADGWTPDKCKIPSKCLKVDNGTWYISMIDISEMSGLHSDAFGLAINRTQRLGHDDENALAELLQEVANSDEIDLLATGFDADDLDNLLRDLGHIGEPTPHPGAQVDRAGELQAKWQVQRGDVWQVGKHRIMCGDSSDMGQLGRLFRVGIDEKKRKIAVITDPPYAFGLASTMNMAVKSGGWHDMMNNASWFVDRYNQWAKLLNAGCIWVFTNWRSLPILMRAAHDSGVGLNSVMVWYKNWIGPGGPVGLRPTYELICLTITDGVGIKDRGVQDFYQADWSSHKPSGHNAEKPVKLLTHLVNITESEIICDPFLGSGTTLVACEQTNRIGYGMEIAPEYVAVSLERLTGMGLEAKHIK